MGPEHPCIFFLSMSRIKGPHCSVFDITGLYLQQQPKRMRLSLCLRQKAGLLTLHYESSEFTKLSLPVL